MVEVFKIFMDKMGVNLFFSCINGSWIYGIGLVFGGDGCGLFSVIKSNGNGIEIDVEKNNGLVKILVEFNLVVISG